MIINSRLLKIVSIYFMLIASCENKKNNKRKNDLGSDANSNLNYQGSVLSDDKNDPCSEYPEIIPEDCRTGGHEVCYNTTNPKHPRQQYNCGHGVTKYKNFLCASDFKVSASDLEGIQCDWKDESDKR